MNDHGGVSLEKRPEAAAADVEVDALALLRLVRARRELRLVWRLALAAVVGWFVVIISVQAATPSWSAPWNWVDDRAWPGFLAIGIVFAAAFVAQALLGRAGPVGRAAARLVPMFARGAEPVVVSGPEAAAGLLPVLRRKAYLAITSVVLFLVFTTATVVLGAQVWPAYRANHGHGGPIVTVGENAFPDGYVVHRRTTTRYSHGGTHRDYFLSTPYGKAIAQDRKPHEGQRYTVLHNPRGNARAYLVGGHDYLLAALAVLLIALFDASVVLNAGLQFTAERRRRVAAGHAPLADSVAALGSGGRARVRFVTDDDETDDETDGESGDAPERAARKRSPAQTYVLGLATARGRSAEQVIARSRYLAFGAGLLAAVVVFGGAGLAYSATLPPPPTDGPVTLSYLSGTGWQPDAYAFWSTDTNEIAIVTSALDEAGVKNAASIRRTWSLVVTSSDLESDATKLSLNVDVVDIGSTAPAPAAAAVIASTRSLAVYEKQPSTPIPGLPAGWAGVRIGAHGSSGPQLQVSGAADGRLVSLQVRLLPEEAAGVSLDRLQQHLQALAAAIEHHGIKAFANDTQRPA